MKTGPNFRSVPEWKDHAGVVEDVPHSVAHRVDDRLNLSEADEQVHDPNGELGETGCDLHPEMYIG